MPPKNFRVIVIGGGPVGLLAAHALQASGIDYVVLERDSAVVKEPGVCNFFFPDSCRVFDQLGLLDVLTKAGHPMTIKENRFTNGKTCWRLDLDEMMKANHGYGMLLLRRSILLQTLYEALPDCETKVKTDKKLVDIEHTHTDEGNEFVRVRLEDGTTEEGSIIIGCDGVHSTTRRIALRGLSGRHGLRFKSRVQTLYGRAKYGGTGTVEQNVLYETHAKGCGTQAVLLDNMLYFALVKTLAVPHVEQKSKTYTDGEAAIFQSEFDNFTIVGDAKWRDLSGGIVWKRLVDQEEGVSDFMFNKRIVLAGDAAVKMTSIAGMGNNTGIQGVIRLVNSLLEIFDTNQPQKLPTTQDLTKAFQKYEKYATKHGKVAHELSVKTTEAMLWYNKPTHIMDQHIFPLFGIHRVTERLFSKDIIRHGKLLKSLPAENLKSGRIAWC